MNGPTRTLALLGVLLLLGAGAFLLVPGPARGPAAVPDERVQARSRSAAVELASPRAERAPALPEPVPSAPPASRPQQGAEARAPDPQPVLRISGTVLDLDGKPIEGAEVLVGSAWEGQDLVARSDASGTFLGELAERPGECEFTVLADGYEGARRDVYRPRGEELRLGTFRLGPGGEVGGRVVDEGGTGLTGALVWWLPAADFPTDFEAARTSGPEVGRYEDDRFYALTPCAADGSYRLRGLPHGECFLAAFAEGRLYGWTPVFEVRAGPLREQEIVLLPSPEAGAPITGRVVEPSGKPVAGLRVLCGEPPGGEFEALASLGYGSGGRGYRQVALTEAEGRFRIFSESAGEVDVGAQDPEKRWATTWIENVRPGTRDLVVRMQPPAWLVVRLVDPDGRAVPWGHVRHENEQLDGGREGIVRLHRPSGPFRVEVSAPGFRKEELGPLEPPPVGEELRLTLHPGQALRGRVVFRGRPVTGARLDLALAAAPGEPMETRGFAPPDHPFVVRGGVDLGGHDGTSDGAGAFVLTIHTRGWHGLRIEAEGFPLTMFGPYELDPAAEQAGLELELERGGALEGFVRTAPGSEARERLVAVSNGWGFVRTAPVDAEGRYRIEDLAPGAYQVRPCAPPAASLQQLGGSMAKAAVVVWDCHVRPGETTRFDLDLVQEGSVVLAGKLELVGGERHEWHASLFAAGTQAGRWSPPRAESTLGADGSFELTLSRPGRYRLEVRTGALRVGEELELFVGRREWTQRLQVGRLRLRAAAAASLETFRFFRYSTRAGSVEVTTLTNAWELRNGAERVFEVPVGPGRVESRVGANAPDAPWTLLCEVEVAPGGETVVEVP